MRKDESMKTLKPSIDEGSSSSNGGSHSRREAARRFDWELSEKLGRDHESGIGLQGFGWY